MRLYFFIYLLGVINTLFLFGGNTYGEGLDYWKQGRVAFQQTNYDLSLEVLNKAAKILKVSNNWSEYVLVLCKIAENQDKLQEFDSMRKTAEKAVELACLHLEEKDVALGMAYHLLGESYWIEAIFNNLPIKDKNFLLKKAIHYFEISEVIFREATDWRGLIENHLNMGFIRVHLESDLKEAERYLQETIGMVKQYFPDADSLQHITLSRAYGSLSKIECRFTGDFDRGLEYAHLSLQHRLELPNKFPQDKSFLANKYLNISRLHFNKKDSSQGMMYLKKAEEIAVGIEPDEIMLRIYHAFSFQNARKFRLDHGYKIDYDKSIEYYHKLLETIEKIDFKIKSRKEKFLLDAYCFLSTFYRKNKNKDKAEFWRKKVEEILSKTNYKQNPNITLLNYFYQQAVDLRDRGEPEKALASLQSCLDHIENHYRLWRESAYLWSKLAGDIFFDKKDYKASLAYSQLSLSLLTNNDNGPTNFLRLPDIENAAYKPNILRALHSKTKVLRQLYSDKNGDIATLKAAFDTYQLMLKMIGMIRQEQFTKKGKQDIGNATLQLYEEAIEVAHQMYQASDDSFYQEQMLLFSEMSKVNLLLEEMNEKYLKNIHLPDSLVVKIEQIEKDLIFYQNLIYQANAENKVQKEKQKVWEEKIYQLQKDKELFQSSLQKKYPNFFRLKYNTQTADVTKIQSMLSPNQAFIEYFWGERYLYTFVVYPTETEKNRKLDIYKLEQTEDLHKELQQLIDHNQNPAIPFSQYLNQSLSVYKKIVHPVIQRLGKTIDNLIIVPDGALSYLPFESLITNSSQSETENYGLENLNYLIENFEINYTYSFSLSLQSQRNHQLEASSANTFLAYAPSFYGVSNGLLVRSCEAELATLNCATSEVESLGERWNVETLIGEEATKKHFLEEAGKHTILHLATHACMDDHNPDFNRIYFANEKYLTSLELHSLQLQTQMAVLSACNTGNGQLVKGEGIMSLARSFIAAGCPSLVTTLWGVNDCATKRLMNHFYQHLHNGETKSEALRNAKLDFLKDEETIRQELHPFYWAGFVQLGESSALFQKPILSPPIITYGLLTILLSLSFLFIAKKRIPH